MPSQHIPVMRAETLQYLNCRPNKIYVDGTLGGGGHAAAICECIAPGGIFIGIDQDADAVANAQTVLKPYQAAVHLFHDSFGHLSQILAQMEIPAADGILLDLGISLDQLMSSGRGFSFQKDEPLDMRMDVRSRPTAYELVNSLDAGRLQQLFSQYGEVRWARRIANRIISARKQQPIDSSRQLADLVAQAVPVKSARVRPIHPATQVFMALRIAVNRELEVLSRFMDNVIQLLAPGGRLCVLTFHSLEDRIVKHRFKDFARDCHCPPDLPRCVCNGQKQAHILTPKALRPSEAEIAENPLARSAKLRAIEKTGT